jgi:hypothetical protein
MKLKLDKGLELFFNEIKVWDGRINNSLKPNQVQQTFFNTIMSIEWLSPEDYAI